MSPLPGLKIGWGESPTLVTNNKFIYGEATDGIRKHLESDFDEIYLMDLGGDVVMNPKLSGTTHNVFGIKLGVSN